LSSVAGVTGAHGGADRVDPPITDFACLTLTALTASLVAARDRHLAARAPVDVLDIGCGSMPDASFDVTLSTQMLEHVREPVRCVAEMGRVVRPGGLATSTRL